MTCFSHSWKHVPTCVFLLAPLERRQVGDLQCNIDRLSTVANLAKTTKAVQQLSSAGAKYVQAYWISIRSFFYLFFTRSDASVTSAASAAMSGLTTAQQGIETIASALLQGQTAPADARTQVGNGLTAASQALGNVTS